MVTFNLSRYHQLLAKNNSLTCKNKDLFDNPVFLELLSFQERVETQVFYNNKNNYFALIQKYLDGTINPNVFRGEFIVMVNKDLKISGKVRKKFEVLSTLWIAVELDEFSALFSSIHQTCLSAFEFEDQEGAMPEDTFRDSIQEIFFKMQKYLNEE